MTTKKDHGHAASAPKKRQRTNDHAFEEMTEGVAGSVSADTDSSTSSRLLHMQSLRPLTTPEICDTPTPTLKTLRGVVVERQLELQTILSTIDGELIYRSAVTFARSA